MVDILISPFGPSLASSQPLAKKNKRGALSFSRAYRINNQDKGVITGVVTEQGRPVSRPVIILNQKGEVLAGGSSDSEGVYSFHGLDENKRYIVLALDVPERKYNAAISDYVKPELL